MWYCRLFVSNASVAFAGRGGGDCQEFLWIRVDSARAAAGLVSFLKKGQLYLRFVSRD